MPASTSSFMYQAGRTFSFSATTTALSDAFATGLESAGVVPSMKHFPGLGFATREHGLVVVDHRGLEDRARARPRPYHDGDRRTTSR